MMISTEHIDPALLKITDEFVEQCTHGAQTKDIMPKGVACGQFIGNKVKQRTQRGLHGTSAALRVLAQGEQSALVEKLIWYVQNREFIHKKTPAPSNHDHDFDEDQKNVVKLSELLYALHFVKTRLEGREALIKELAVKLLNSSIENKGWSHFLVGGDGFDSLPTAFAILALSQHGYKLEIKDQVAFLEKSIIEKTNNKELGITETSVIIFSLFALVFREEELPLEKLKPLKKCFIKIWKTHSTLLSQDVEQTIEYWNGSNNYYLRIPWQLYLLALAARLDPGRISGFSAQRKLRKILNSITKDGFFYPNSGTHLSSRTYAVAFDVLHKIKRYNNQNPFNRIYYFWDYIKAICNHWITSATALSAAVISGFYCLYTWIINPWNPKDIGPDLGGACIVLLISYTIEKIKKTR